MSEKGLFCLRFWKIFLFDKEFKIDMFLVFSRHCFTVFFLALPLMRKLALTIIKWHFITGFYLFDCDRCWSCFLHVSCTWVLLSFLDISVYGFHQLWKRFGHYWFKYFLFPFHPISIAKTSIIRMLGCWSCPTTHCYSVHFHHYFFLNFFILNSFYCYII